MFTFRIFGHPVHVQWMFWLLCVLLGMPYLENSNTREGLGQFLILTAVVFGSIIWHELGHAWARKRCGSEYSEITLYGFGGLCSGPGYFTRWESVFIAAAGPAASLLLGGATWMLTLTPGMGSPWVRQFVGEMLWVNIGWAIFNLLPILPLDGGRIFEGLAGPRNFKLVIWTSIILAGLLAIGGLVSAIGGLVSGQLWIGVMMGYIAYSNWQRLHGLPTRMY